MKNNYCDACGAEMHECCVVYDGKLFCDRGCLIRYFEDKLSGAKTGNVEVATITPNGMVIGWNCSYCDDCGGTDVACAGCDKTEECAARCMDTIQRLQQCVICGVPTIERDNRGNPLCNVCKANRWSRRVNGLCIHCGAETQFVDGDNAPCCQRCLVYGPNGGGDYND